LNFPLYSDDYIARAIKGKHQLEDEIHIDIITRLQSEGIKIGMYFCYGIIIILSHIPIVSSFFETFARTYARGAVGFFLRGSYYKNKLKKMGKNVFIDVGVVIWEPENVEIDDCTFIDTYVTMMGGRKGHGYIRVGKYAEVASNCILAGRGGITIGNHVGIGAGSNIYSGTHLYRDPNGEDDRLLSGSILAPLEMQYVVEKPVLMEDFSWIGGNTIVMPGVKIGKGAVVGAGSVVNSDIPRFSVAVGAPAKVIKQRPIIS
jgi:acetyltransferase-like isoleucine patch superfamily enzyme